MLDTPDHNISESMRSIDAMTQRHAEQYNITQRKVGLSKEKVRALMLRHNPANKHAYLNKGPLSFKEVQNLCAKNKEEGVCKKDPSRKGLKEKLKAMDVLDSILIPTRHAEGIHSYGKLFNMRFICSASAVHQGSSNVMRVK